MCSDFISTADRIFVIDPDDQFIDLFVWCLNLSFYDSNEGGRFLITIL